MHPNIFQSAAWAKYQESQTKNCYFQQDENYQFFAQLHQNPHGSYLTCPYGPYLTDNQLFKLPLSKLQDIAHQNNAIFVRIRPQLNILPGDIEHFKLKIIKDSPVYAFQIRLDRSLDEIFSKVPSKNLENFKTYAQKEISIKKSHNPADAQILSNFIAKNHKYHDFSTKNTQKIADLLKFDFATLWIATADATPIAAALVFDDELCKYFICAAPDEDYENLDIKNTLILQMISDAKNEGKKFFEFWNQSKPNPQNSPNILFETQPIEFPYAYDLILDQQKYKKYNSRHKIQQLKAKIFGHRHRQG